MSKIGIFAGSFDPVHLGHVQIANLAVRSCGLDKVYFLVEPSPRKKQGVKALEHRTTMVEIALRDQPNLGTIVLDHSRFTISDTLPVLMNRFKGSELHLIMGDDVAMRLAEWPDLPDLISKTKLIIAIRHSFQQKIKDSLKSISRIKNQKLDYRILHVDQQDVSSTTIRKKLKVGETPSGLDSKVLDYIQSKSLYASDSES